MQHPLQRAAARALAALAAASLLGACATSSVRQHPDFAARRGGIAAVALAPARVEATRAAKGGARTPLREQVERVSERLPDLLAAELEQRGMAGLELRLDAEAENSALRRACRELDAAHVRAGTRLWSEVEMSEDEALAFEASLGPPARALAGPLGADAVLLARYTAFDDAGAERDEDEEDAASELLEAALGHASPPAGPLRGSLLEVALADGRTGEILWAHAAARSDPSERALEPLVRAVFAAFPSQTQERVEP
jgi:hypothetical protein